MRDRNNSARRSRPLHTGMTASRRLQRPERVALDFPDRPLPVVRAARGNLAEPDLRANFTPVQDGSKRTVALGTMPRGH